MRGPDIDAAATANDRDGFGIWVEVGYYIKDKNLIITRCWELSIRPAEQREKLRFQE